MTELSLLFQRIIDENETTTIDLTNLLLDPQMTNEQNDTQIQSYESYSNDYFSQFSSFESNNLYVNIIEKLKCKIDYFDNEHESNSNYNDENIPMFNSYLQNVNDIKTLITDQFVKLNSSENCYLKKLNKLKSIHKLLLELSEIKYESENQKIISKQESFQDSLFSYISSLNEDNDLNTLHEDFLKELNLFRKYISMGNIISEVQQIPICVLCMENIPSYAFECGHVCCDKCIIKLKKSNKCFSCRGSIDKKIKLYLFN